MEEVKKETTKEEPKVTVFGHDIGGGCAEYEFGDDKDGEADKKDWNFHHHYHCHHHHHGSFLWGLAFILVGALFLLSNFGALPPNVWQQISHLWPLLIIFIGIDILIGQTVVSDLINSLVGLFIFLTILGVIFLHVSPSAIHSLPKNIQDYLVWLNTFLQIK